MFQYAYMYSQVREGIIPDVYVQSEKYFEKYKDEIKALYSTDISSLPYVALHVRRGDYVGNPFYIDLFEDGYYERAMKEFRGETFIVFSDDIPWCKRQSLFDNCLFANGEDEVSDFNDMASCKGHIIANSSYSWWAAYISPNVGKVIAPEHWHPDKVERTVLPKEWLKI